MKKVKLGIWGRVVFSQMTPVIKLARTKVIEVSDLPPLPPALDPQNQLKTAQIEASRGSMAFVRSLLWAHRDVVAKTQVNIVLAFICAMSSPWLLRIFIQSLETNSELRVEWAWAGALTLVTALSGVFLQHYYYHFLRGQQKITNDLNALIYRKSLRLSQTVKAQSSVGEIVNLMGSDADSISDVIPYVNDLLWTVFSLIAASVQLVYFIGWQALYALGLFLVGAPLIRIVAKRFVRFEEKMLEFRDRRINFMGQVLNAIRIIKYFGWEKSIQDEVKEIRDQENKMRRHLFGSEIISSSIIALLSQGALIIAISAWAHQKNSGVATIFATISIFGLLEEPLAALSRHIKNLTQCSVSIKRLLTFLASEEKPELSQDRPLSEVNALEIKNLVVPSKDRTLLAIKDLNIKFGESVAIIGGVGSGKSILLQTILGEWPHQGEILIADRLKRAAYVPQDPFLINGSLLNNIEFGNFHSGSAIARGNLLRNSLRGSALDQDWGIFGQGLATEIGEKGINLSGGQKQRVGLARAIYSNPDLVLLDDPLSALDHRTEKRVLDRLIFGEFKDKTRLVVTHKLNFLDRFDRILLLNNGNLLFSGSPGEAAKNSDMRKFLAESNGQSLLSQYHYQREAGFRDPAESVNGSQEADTSLDTKEIPEIIPLEGLFHVSSDIQIESESTRPEARVTIDEDRARGGVKAGVYLNYLRALGGVLPLIGLTLITHILPLLQRAWVTQESAVASVTKFLQGFVAIGICAWLMSLLNQLFWLRRGQRAAAQFHDSTLNGVLFTRARFFDATPIGRILQRFSRDLDSVDLALQGSFEGFVHTLVQLVVIIILISSLLPWMLFVFAPILLIYYQLQLDYRRPAREIKRMDSIARSPRYAHFKETLIGLSVIRAFAQEEAFYQSFIKKLAASQRVAHAGFMTNRWFSGKIPIVAAIVSLFTCVLAATFVHSGALTAAVGGLVVTYGLGFWGQLNWVIRVFSDIESRMTSVERLQTYAKLLPEPLVTKPEPLPFNSKPHLYMSGSIEFRNVSLKYDSGFPLVIEDASFFISSGQKVGILGPTGAGKSTLFAAIYRMIDTTSGDIFVGGRNIGGLPLPELRSYLALVPQDPILLMGRLRENLDRTNRFSDEQIWDALRKVGLEESILSRPEQLNCQVLESGHNFSQGQRQLICLARALLLRAKVILMDEATANVDMITDRQIHRVLNESLSGVTLLLIAHRLETLSECDLFIRVDRGKVQVQTKKLPEPDLHMV